MAKSDEPQNSRLTKSLVVATWVLVAVAMYANWSNNESSSELLDEAKKAIRLQWRPFLNIEYSEYSLLSAFELSDVNQENTKYVPLEEISIESSSYLAAHYYKHYLTRDVTLSNIRTSPLRVTRIINSALDSEQWSNTFGKSETRLVDSLRKLTDPPPLDLDLVILPDSSYLNDSTGTYRNMPIKVFNRALSERGELLLYPYTYIEYEDVFDNRYNTIYIEYHLIPMKVSEGYISITGTVRYGVEKYRWDIPVRDR